jgi:hypothetical protein
MRGVQMVHLRQAVPAGMLATVVSVKEKRARSLRGAALLHGVVSWCSTRLGNHPNEKYHAISYVCLRINVDEVHEDENADLKSSNSVWQWHWGHAN